MKFALTLHFKWNFLCRTSKKSMKFLVDFPFWQCIIAQCCCARIFGEKIDQFYLLNIVLAWYGFVWLFSLLSKLKLSLRWRCFEQRWIQVKCPPSQLRFFVFKNQIGHFFARNSKMSFPSLGPQKSLPEKNVLFNTGFDRLSQESSLMKLEAIPQSAYEKCM